MSKEISEKLVRQIADRLSFVRSSIENYSNEIGVNPPELIAVSKTKPVEYIQAAYDCGQRHFGENYAQEMARKAEILSDFDITWHFIGHLQRRHVSSVSSISTFIHAVDSTRVLDRLKSVGSHSNILVQVNISSELSKFGVKLENAPELVEYGRNLGLKIRGLMTIGAFAWSEEETVHAFRRVAQMKDNLSLDYLSAGMSGDWKSAVLVGSTHVRIGTAIFGSRE